MVPHLTRLARKVEGRLQSGFKVTWERSRRAARPRRQLGYPRSKRPTHPRPLRGQPCHLRITTRRGPFHRMVLSPLYFTALSCSHSADRSQVWSSKVPHPSERHLRGQFLRKAHRILSLQDKDIPHVKNKATPLLELMIPPTKDRVV